MFEQRLRFLDVLPMNIVSDRISCFQLEFPGETFWARSDERSQLGQMNVFVQMTVDAFTTHGNSRRKLILAIYGGSLLREIHAHLPG